MLLGGKGGCQQCTCGVCDPCTRTCQNPHTGAAFQSVGRGFSPEIGDEGAVSGRLTDGYLTAIGNFDADLNGMSGSGPYYQQVGGAFFLDSVQTRFPCSLTVSFWRNTFTSSDPPASAALTLNRVTITCLAGQFAIQGWGILLNPGESHEFNGGIPVSTTGDPHSSTGTYGGFATCDNTQVSIQARIEWNVQPRVHVLLGIVRECYEEGTPCATVCGGSPPPSNVYLTISNIRVTSTGSAGLSGDEATYVLSRVPNFCFAYSSPWSDTCSDWAPTFGPRSQLITLNQAEMYMERHEPRPGCIGTWLRITNTGSPWDFCVSGSTVASGTNGQWGNEGSTFGTFDWTISK
jgi:hypothetical protein